MNGMSFLCVGPEPDPAATAQVWVSRRVILPGEAAPIPAAVVVRNGRIDAVLVPPADLPADLIVRDFGEWVLLPGLVDGHVHLNEPGRTDWEGAETGTRAAAFGGVTTLVDMPLNSSPVTTTVAALREKQAAIAGKCAVNVYFHAGIVPGNAGEIPALLEAGVVGVKAFLVHSGIDEFPAATEADLRAVMPLLQARNIPLLVHCETESCSAPSAHGATRYADYLRSRPPDWEIDAIGLVLRLCEETGCRVHIVHLSAAGALPLLQKAREAGLPVTVETAPHYLFFVSETIPDRDTRYKCAPPIRDTANREALWGGLRDGSIDLIQTDHSPCPPAMKGMETGDFGAAWGGIASIQLGLSVVWTEAARRGFSLSDVARWMATNPACALGLTDKGAIRVGADADMVVFDPEMEWTVDANRLFHRHPVTPYDGKTLRGRVRAVFVGGREVVSESLTHLNSLPAEEAAAAFLRCCGSSVWARGMAAARPFPDQAALASAAERGFDALTPDDWQEAFAHHPEIGDVSRLREKFADTAAWASGEQAGTASASEATLHALSDGNRAYRERFGFVFLVCATGKSADEMLTLLRERLPHDAATEARIAADEQRKITHLRLSRLLGDTAELLAGR